MKTANAPLFKDPIHNGAADPVVIYNEETGTHYMLYTARRADVEEEGVMWVHGTDIGIAESKDNGNSWEYIGICQGLEYGEGKNTYWAPEVIRFGELYHMYVSYVPGIPADWNHPRYILHYTSKNLIDWNFESKLNLSSEKIIDACVFRLSNGIFRMWYKDERNGSHTYFADSKDLYNWEVKGCAADDVPHEGANVFGFGGKYWLITDCWSGLDVYYSDDLTTWAKQSSRILDVGGTREDDGVIANHADVYVTDIFSTSLTLTGKKICLKIISETNAERQFKLPNLKLKTVFWYVTEIRIYQLNSDNIKGRRNVCLLFCRNYIYTVSVTCHYNIAAFIGAIHFHTRVT